MTKDELKSKVMGCLPSEYIKDSITAGRIANNILDIIAPLLKFEKEWISIELQLPPDVKENVNFKMPDGKEKIFYGSYVNVLLKDDNYLPEYPRPSHWKL